MTRKNEAVKLEYKQNTGDVLTYKDTIWLKMSASPELELDTPIEVKAEFKITRMVVRVSPDGVIETIYSFL